MLERVKPEYLRRAYKLKAWTDAEDFLSQIARRTGKLTKGGEPDLNTAAKMVLHDWQRGKIPFFTLPPDHVGEESAQLPAPAEAVTEEDAAAALDGNPEVAAAAARKLVEEAVAATAKQTKSTIPIQEGFYTPEDEGLQDGVEEEEDEGSLCSEDNCVSDQQGGEEASSEVDEAEGEDEDDDDGYGDAGLSWQSVLATLQGGRMGGEEERNQRTKKRQMR